MISISILHSIAINRSIVPNRNGTRNVPDAIDFSIVRTICVRTFGYRNVVEAAVAQLPSNRRTINWRQRVKVILFALNVVWP